MQPTRWQIVQILKHRGRATVDELAKELGITLMAVRLHLMVLERDSLVSRSTVREGPGRPTLVYRLTEKAEDVFPKDYEKLANALMATLKANLGEGAAERICLSAARDMAAHERGLIGHGPLEERLAALAGAEAGEEGAESQYQWEQGDDGFFLQSYSCPYFRVAQQHREVCVLHRQYLQSVLQADVSLVSSLLDGDLRCSFLVREAATVRSDEQVRETASAT